MAVLLLTLFPCAALGAEEMVLHRFTSKQPDPQVEDVLYFAAGTALMQAGLSSTRQEGAADYILSTQYASGEEQTEVQYSLSRPSSPQDSIAEITVDLPADATLSAAVETAVHRLLATAGIEEKPSPGATIADLLPAPPAASEEKPKPAAAAADETPGSRAVVVETPGTARPGAASPIAFDSSISAAGVLLFGAIADFLHYGVGGVLRAGISWPQTTWRPTVGAQLSFTRAFNDAGVTGGPLYLSTAGPMLQVGTGTGSPYSASIALSGGAAMITVQTAAGVLTQTTPYADGAIQFVIPIVSKVFIGADVRVLAIFASDVFILAVMPAVTTRLEL